MGFLVFMKLTVFALRMWPCWPQVYLCRQAKNWPVSGSLARFGKSSCPVSITELIITVLSQSNSPYSLVRRIVRSKSGEYFHASMGASISILREEFKKYIQPFIDDFSKYGTHSMRSGAKSNPAWRCPSSKNRYIKHTIKDRLSFSKSLLLWGYTLRKFTVYCYLAERAFLTISLWLFVFFFASL